MHEYLLEQERLNAVAPKVEESAGARLAGLWIDWQPAPVLIVSMTGNTEDSRVTEALGSVSSSSEVRYGAAYSRATFVEQRWNSSLDVQWHRVDPVTQAVAPLFHVSKTVARPQGSVSSVLPGAQICKWGSRSLSYTCGNVTSINFAPSQCGPSGGPCSNAFVRVSIGSGNTCKGDSGGPWFVGNTAVGVHNGASPYLTAEDLCASGSNKHAHFTPIPAALGTLGLALFTG